jgi:hypothetical protein
VLLHVCLRGVLLLCLFLLGFTIYAELLNTLPYLISTYHHHRLRFIGGAHALISEARLAVASKIA